MKRILIIEDSEAKFDAVLNVVQRVASPSALIERSATLTAAEERVSKEEWDLVVLDVSMDISASNAGPLRGGHATLGGLGIARKMFLLGRDVDTVIVTAFDAFQSTVAIGGAVEILGLEEVEANAKDILGEKFIGCVRYSESGWAERLEALLKGRI